MCNDRDAGNCSGETIRVVVMLSLLAMHVCPVTNRRQLTDESTDGADSRNVCKMTSVMTGTTGRTAVHAARTEELRVKSRRVTREVAISTTMRKWKLLIVIVTNASARFPLRRNAETLSKMGQDISVRRIVILQW